MLNEFAVATTPEMNGVYPVDAPTSLRRDDAIARAHLYRLIAGAFLEEPTAGFLSALRQPESLAELRSIGVDFAADFLAPDLDALADTLAVEYAALFLASGGFPPIESARLTGRLQQEPCFDLRRTYAQHGFAVGGTRFHVYEDQLGVELLFVAELLDRAVAAIDAADRDRVRRLEKEIKRFWTQHLGRWVRGYAGLIARASHHSFFRGMAGLLQTFAGEEIAAMRLRVADEDEGKVIVPKVDPAVEINPNEPVCSACDKGRLADLVL